jgi:hypothetical protein
VYGSTAKGERLMGELWVDVSAAQATVEGQAALNRLERGETMEVSWGWWQVAEPTAGEFKGNAYDAISRNLIPDHLALLLNSPGACSVADGCGTYRVNQAEFSLLTNGWTCAKHGGQPPHPEVFMSDELARDGEDVEEVAAFDTPDQAPVTAVTDPVTQPEAIAANVGDVATLRQELQELKQVLSKLQANAEQKEQQERNARIYRLAGNAACPFDADDLRGFTDAQLQTFEAKYRTADLSARGGNVMSANRQTVAPLGVPQVLLAPVKGREVAHG